MTDRYEEAADRTATETLAIALGWFSIALGVVELLAPRRVAALVGVPSSGGATTTLRAYGAREIANGLAILADPAEATWLWSRLGGDALDIAWLGGAAGREGANRARLACATAAVAGVAALDVFAAISLTAHSRSVDELSLYPTSEQAVTVKDPLEAVESAWIAWCAAGRTKLKGDYVVRFEPAPGARGTQVHLSGGGSKGEIREELRHFKQRLETGEISQSDGPALSRPAQPRDSQAITEVRS